jgi:hypothetical protein
MDKDKALDLALKFFETMQRYKGTRSNIFIRFEPTATGDYVDLREFDEKAKPIITAIKKARSAPVQEPVATLWQHGETGRTRIIMPGDITDCDARWFKAADLYTTPPAAQRQWVGLTDKDISDTATTHPMTWVNLNAVENRTLFARILEAKLKEKNT